MARRPTETEADATEQVVIDEVTANAVIDAPADEPEPDEAPDGVWVTYRGHANALTYGETRLRPGVPTFMSKEAAEGIATTPFEDVHISTSQPEE